MKLKSQNELEASMSKSIAVLARRVESRILLLRGQRVILDSDLAELYGIEVKRLNQQVKRNARRFPSDFLMRLSVHEAANLRSQIVTTSLRVHLPENRNRAHERGKKGQSLRGLGRLATLARFLLSGRMPLASR